MEINYSNLFIRQVQAAKMSRVENHLRLIPIDFNDLVDQVVPQ